ncbi:MAG: hypothetical protein QNJ15_10280 [Erythrobacter sp.]|nr:hypothetical protein [Erythrobacter sp.]
MPEIPEDLKDHVIHTEGGKLSDAMSAAIVDRISQQAVAKGKIVIYMHGGLVSYENGLGTASKLVDDFTGPADAYPIFMVWESWLTEAIWNNLREIASERILKLIWKKVSEIVVRKAGQDVTRRSARQLPLVDTRELNAEIEARLDEVTAPEAMSVENEHGVNEEIEPIDDWEERMLEAEMARDFQLSQEIARISNSLRSPADIAADGGRRSAHVQGSTRTLMAPDALDKYVDRPEPGSRGLISKAKMIKAIVSVAIKVIRRYRNKRDHGFHATVVEEILREFYLSNVGGYIWNLMKQDTADAFGGDRMVHGGTALLYALREAIDASDGPPPKIWLVGHSAGSIYAANFMKYGASILPNGTEFHVQFMAPAITCEMMADTLSGHQSSIAAYRMYTMDDDREKADRLVPVLYPHSLLYFISGVLEDESDKPIVGMERYFDGTRYPGARFPAVESVRNFHKAGPDRSVWSVTNANAAQGLRSEATDHGGFDDDPATIDSVTHMI